jgi:hypothetical protein
MANRAGYPRSLLLAAVAALAVSTAACGVGGARSVLDETHENLSGVRSGDLRMSMTASAGTEGSERPVGFEVAGPFSVPANMGELPLARLRRTRMVGTALEPTTFVSTGQRAYVEVDGKAYELPEEQVTGLRAQEAPRGGGAGLSRLELSKWAVDPKLSEAGSVGGVPAQRVTAAVDVVKALNDIVSVANDLGTGPDEGLRPVDAGSAERVKRAVQSSSLEVITSKDDRVLRRLRLDVTFAAADHESLASALGPLTGTRLHFEVELSGVNRKVEVPSPADPRPLSELRRDG